jgi:hypothetical protein
MIIENVEDNACIMMVFLVQPFGSLPENRVRVCESVNCAVQVNALLDIVWKMTEIFPTDAVGHEIPDLDQVIVSG